MAKRQPKEVPTPQGALQEGPHIPLGGYFDHWRHWTKRLQTGCPRTPEQQFLELEREGIACLYDALSDLVEEQYPPETGILRYWLELYKVEFPRWNDGFTEQDRLKSAWAVLGGSGEQYGESYARAKVRLLHRAVEPCEVTNEGAVLYRRWEWFGVGEISIEEVAKGWAAMYAEEVRHLLGEKPEDETLAAFARLHATVKGWAFGAREGSRIMERLKSKSVFIEILAAFQRIREQLNTLLDEIADEHLSQPDPMATTGTTATQGTTDRLKWKSSTAAFVHIFNTLAAGGYFDLPTKGGKGNDPNTAAFARMLLQAFDVPGKDGNPITSEMLRVRLADRAPGQLAEAKAAKFQIPDAGALIVPNAGELE